MIRKQLIIIVSLAILFAPNIWAAQVAIVSGDTLNEAWAKETLNNSDLQTNINLKADITSETFVTPNLGTIASGDGAALTGLQFDQFITQTAWRLFYSDAAGDVKEVELGVDGTVFTSGGVDQIPGFEAVSVTGDALVANPLSQFAATTSAQLYGVISDETGTGVAVFNDGPTLIAPVLGTIASGDGAALTGLQFDQFVTQTAWRVFYSNTGGDVTELALGADGTYLMSNGAAVAPTFETPSGSGDVTAAAALGDNLLIRGDGAVKGVQNSGITIDDSDNISGVADLEATSVTIPQTATAQGIVLYEASAAGTNTHTITAQNMSASRESLWPDYVIGFLNSGQVSSDGSQPDAIEFVIDGGGSAITTGVKGFLEVPWDCTINSTTVLADQSGSIVVDIWVDTYTNYPPTDADTITSSTPPTITTATKSQDTTLTSWTVALTKGDIIGFNVDSVTTCERVTISLKVDK